MSCGNKKAHELNSGIQCECQMPRTFRGDLMLEKQRFEKRLSDCERVAKDLMEIIKFIQPVIRRLSNLRNSCKCESPEFPEYPGFECDLHRFDRISWESMESAKAYFGEEK